MEKKKTSSSICYSELDRSIVDASTLSPAVSEFVSEASSKNGSGKTLLWVRGPIFDFVFLAV